VLGASLADLYALARLSQQVPRQVDDGPEKSSCNQSFELLTANIVNGLAQRAWPGATMPTARLVS
jgi:hypothetical protein